VLALSAERRRLWTSARVLLLALMTLGAPGCERAYESPAAPWSDVISVREPLVLPRQLHAQRVSVGHANDYKPNLAALPDGELLLSMSEPVTHSDGTYQENMVLYRSPDGGQTWGSRQVLPLLGREPCFSVLRDGTLFLTAQLLSTDYRNTEGYDYALVYRSINGGTTWSTLAIRAQDVPGVEAGTPTHTSRNILELQDGSLVMGVSAGSGTDYLWRSFDQGQTWNRAQRSRVEGYDVAAQGRAWYGEMVLFQARDGDLLGIARTPADAVPPYPDTQIPAGNEATDRMVLFRSRDTGRTWTLEESIGDYYGEMYPSLLRFGDGRLLFTFTVRDLHAPLGVRAVLGNEKSDGFSLNFGSDPIMLDDKTPLDQQSGGGFGNTVRFPGGLLATAYSYRGADSDTHVEVVRWVLPYYVTVADAWGR